MNYYCAISGVSMGSQDIYSKVFTIQNYYVYILIREKELSVTVTNTNKMTCSGSPVNLSVFKQHWG